jgi:hypothetical protein
VTVAVEIVVAVVTVLGVMLVLGLFVWAAKKDGEADDALQSGSESGARPGSDARCRPRLTGEHVFV